MKRRWRLRAGRAVSVSIAGSAGGGSRAPPPRPKMPSGDHAPAASRRGRSADLALLSGLCGEWRRHGHDLVATTFRAARLARSMFGHGLDALEGLLALIAAIDVGWHDRGPPFTSRFDIRESVAPESAGERRVPPLLPSGSARSDPRGRPHQPARCPHSGFPPTGTPVDGGSRMPAGSGRA
jgi:hypothetical protein